MIKTFSCKFGSVESAEMAAYNIRRNVRGIKNISIIPSERRMNRGNIPLPMDGFAGSIASVAYDNSAFLASYNGNVVAVPGRFDAEPYQKTDAVLEIVCEDGIENRLHGKLINLGALEITSK